MINIVDEIAFEFHSIIIYVVINKPCKRRRNLINRRGAFNHWHFMVMKLKYQKVSYRAFSSPQLTLIYFAQFLNVHMFKQQDVHWIFFFRLQNNRKQ